MVEYNYPDVLGTITGGVRLELGSLQCAVGVYPDGVALGQPFELLVVVQSTIDQPQDVTLTIRLPRKDASGNRLSFFVPRKEVKVEIGPGEVGVVQIPVVAQPPTPAVPGYPVMVKVATRVHHEGKAIRAPGAGRPPSTLSVSPFRLEVLRDVPFTAEADKDQLRCRFNVIPGQVKVGLLNPVTKYESLWTARDFQLEQGKIEERYALAERAAYEFTRGNIFLDIEEATRERFAKAGLPLHPGESLFITKIITYIFDDAYQYERDFELDDARWFQWFCSMLVRDEALAEQEKGLLAAGELYYGGLYDAVRIGLTMVESATGQRYGPDEEHRRYADKVVQAVQGNAPIDLSHAYLPLVMAGVLLNMQVDLRGENLWDSLDLLEEAVRGRMRLAVGQENPIFTTLQKLIDDGRQLLHRSRVPRE